MTTAATQPIHVPDHLGQIPHAPEGWDWRPLWQRDITSRIVNSKKKIVILQAEPGSGKTTIAWAVAQLMPGQALIMVRTRQLERQYLRDFSDLIMMEGRRHFICNLTENSTKVKTADRGKCTIGMDCDLKGTYNPVERRYTSQPACHYYRAKSDAIDGKVSIHNYSYWLGETKALEGVSGFESPNLIVCDEAHEIERVLMEHEVIEIRPPVIKGAGLEPCPRTDLKDIKSWAVRNLPVVRMLLAAAKGDDDEGNQPEFDPEMVPEASMDDIEVTVDRVKELSAALDPLEGLTSIPDDQLLDEWVLDMEDSQYHTIKVRPIYGRRGIQKIINAARSKVLFMSAYLAPELFIETLGLNPDDCEIIEAEPVYDRRNSPVAYMPVTKMNFRTEDYMWDRVVKLVDVFIDYYAPKSGLLHVPSVNLRNRILRSTTHKGMMVTYDGEFHTQRREGAMTKDEAIEDFKSRAGQSVLLGQSISTGVDIPYVPQWQIIVKMPFPPATDPAMKERMARDKSFYVFLTICDLVQAVGRIKRAPDHDGPSIILDGNFEWFYAANKRYFPQWFIDALGDNMYKWPVKTDVKMKQLMMRRGVQL